MHEFTKDENNPTVLVTSSIEETWGNKEKILFLSEGCLKFTRRNIWENLDFKILENIWNHGELNESDYSYLNDVNEIILERLTLRLNEIHNTNYSVRYWRILLGFWLKFFIHIYYDRWETLKYVEENYSNIKMNTLQHCDDDLIPNTTADFFDLVSTDIWNEFLYSDIALKWTGIEVKKQDNSIYPLLTLKSKNNYITNIFKWLFKKIHILSYKLSYKYRNSSFFIYYPYLNPKSHAQINFKLKSPILPFIKYVCPISKVNPNLRNWDIAEEHDDLFINAVTKTLSRVMPKCFLEGYEKVANFKTLWPDSPKVIMTANAFAFDEIWSAWAAKLIEQGSKLVIAQHGGTYGTIDFPSHFDYEYSISDKYISWGWKYENSKNICEGPAVKLINLEKRSKDLGSKCLLVLQSESRFPRDVGFNIITKDMPKYLSNQIVFTKSLSKPVQESLQIRLYGVDFGWEIRNRLEVALPNVELVDFRTKINKLLDDTKLCVCSYNGTTFLETFTRNIPTVIFWDKDTNKLNSQAQHYFDLLHETSILHYTPEDCAEFINSIWDDVSGWWNSVHVKQAIKVFSSQFANVGDNPISKLHSTLTNW